jgi:hypothetical protein
VPTFNQLVTELVESFKAMEDPVTTITIEKVIDPTRRPNGWKSAISVQVAMQFAQHEILVLVGPVTNGYYYR